MFLLIFFFVLIPYNFDFFFFQAEDGIRDKLVTGVQTCALPISYEGQNGQSQKDSFVQKTRGRTIDNYLKSTRTEPLSRYEIKAGWDIPATLEQAIDSDLPGDVKALVRSNVYDTATGEYLLIPQGARLLGTYNSAISYGQARVQVVWTRIIFPDGSSINLDGMSGHD